MDEIGHPLVPVTDIGNELLFENEVVRVWSMVLEPDQESPFHVHKLDYLFVYVTPSTIAFMETPGEVKETREYGDGYVAYNSVGDGITHQIRNVSVLRHRQILVELKAVRGEAPSSTNSRVGEPL